MYSMGNGSSDEPKLLPTGKKVDVQALFYFFLRHSKKSGDFFTKLVGFLLKKSSKSLENNPNFPTTASK